MYKYTILDEENNIIGATSCERACELTTNKVVEVGNCPDEAVGNAMLIDGEIVYNDDYKNSDETQL